MDAEHEDRIHKAALDTWGMEAQLGMLVEECAELIVAVQHLRRKRIGMGTLIEEMADVENMLAQFKRLFPILFELKRVQKLERLEQRLIEAGVDLKDTANA